MLKEGGVSLTCRQCGKQYTLTRGEEEFYEQKGLPYPSRCDECHSVNRSRTSPLVCSQCGAGLEKGAVIYCADCQTKVYSEYELKIKQSQKAASAAHSKLLACESQKAEIEELIRQKERLVEELESKVNSLSIDLEKAVKFHAALEWLQPVLTGMEERLTALEFAHNKINERMLQLIQKIHELHDETSLFEIIKRSFRQYRREGA